MQRQDAAPIKRKKGGMSLRAFPKTLPDRTQNTVRNPLRNHRSPRAEFLSRNNVLGIGFLAH